MMIDEEAVGEERPAGDVDCARQLPSLLESAVESGVARAALVSDVDHRPPALAFVGLQGFAGHRVAPRRPAEEERIVGGTTLSSLLFVLMVLQGGGLAFMVFFFFFFFFGS